MLHISILHLAEQYLLWVAEARRKNLELAADYLVMAAWLAYLKSRLLLPDLSEEEQPSAEEMAAALAFQLKRLESMRTAGAQLLERPNLGKDFFARGAPEKFKGEAIVVYDISLYDLLSAYGQQVRRQTSKTLHIEVADLYSMEQALSRLRTFLGNTPEWKILYEFLPKGLSQGLPKRAAIAATFAAALELVRDGHLELDQNATYGPIYLRSPSKQDKNTPS